MKKIAITMGDPAGVGPEVLTKALKRLNPVRVRRTYGVKGFKPIVIGDRVVFKEAVRRLKSMIPQNLQFLDIPVGKKVFSGKPNIAGARAALSWIEQGIRICKKGHAEALVTLPVSKGRIIRAGINFKGHTEFLAAHLKVKDIAMLLYTPLISFLPLTRHIPISKVSSCLTKGLIVKSTLLAVKMFKRMKIKEKALILALNPHAGEDGVLGNEEKRVIIPAVRVLKSKGINILGPLPADTGIKSALEGNFNLVICPFHDQALIPLKIMGFEKAINITLGLPFLRTSPLHGTGFDIAGKGCANEESCLRAIGFCLQYRI